MKTNEQEAEATGSTDMNPITKCKKGALYEAPEKKDNLEDYALIRNRYAYIKRERKLKTRCMLVMQKRLLHAVVWLKSSSETNLTIYLVARQSWSLIWL